MGGTVSVVDLEKYIVDNVETAIREGYIKIYYQPVIRTITGKICAAEALTRWEDPNYGFLSPASYISALTKAKKIHLLDIHVINSVCRDIREKIDNGDTPFPVSVNITQYDFTECDMLNVFEEAEQDSGVPAKYLCLEINEEIFRDNSDIQRVIDQLLSREHEKWLSDFGIGYGAFSALEKKYSVIKFDVRFLHSLKGENLKRGRIIIAYYINMVKRLNFSTLVEGIETEEEYDYFKDLGCEMIQGFFFSKPMPIKELDKQGFEVESIEERGYYNTIGQIEIENGSMYDQTGVFGADAMAIFEYKDQTFTYLYQNEANKQYLRFLGDLTSQSAERIINQKSGLLQEKLRPFIRELKNEKKDIRFSHVYRGNIINIRAKFVAKNPKTGALACVVYTSMSHDSHLNRAALFTKAKEELYRMYDRIDLIDMRDGRIKNTYMNTTEYGGISEGALFTEAAEEWSREYITPEERDEFMEFMDLSTFKARMIKRKGIRDRKKFRTQMDDGRYLPKAYILLPIEMDGKDMVLSGIVNIDAAEQ